jgi:hypothetical protein
VRDSHLWGKFHGEERLAAGVVLYELHRALSFAEDKTQEAVDIVTQCASDVRELASYCLSNRQYLKNLKRFLDDESITQYWIELLEHSGQREQLPLLVSFVEDTTYGRSALLAVRAIKARDAHAA